MRAVVQRVTRSEVFVDGKRTGAIEKGLMILVGVSEQDEEKDACYLADKIPNLRIFEDAAGKMNVSLLEAGGEILAVSQFTLYGDCRKGKRPSFIEAARPEKANALYRKLIEEIKAQGVCVAEGVFQAEMLVRIDNDGPVTLLLDSKKIF